MRLGFEYNIYDTNLVKDNFGIRVAKIFHKNSKERTIYRDLFFREGQRLSPYLLADNERRCLVSARIFGADLPMRR